jgi:hypothetical protein
MRDARLLHDGVCCVTRQDIGIDGKMRVGVRAMPDLMVAFALPDKTATVVSQDILNCAREAGH